MNVYSSTLLFCIAASLVAFAAYAWLPAFDTMPLPVLLFFVAVDFVVGPVGVVLGGFWDSSVPGKSSTQSLVR